MIQCLRMFFRKSFVIANLEIQIEKQQRLDFILKINYLLFSPFFLPMQRFVCIFVAKYATFSSEYRRKAKKDYVYTRV